MSLMTHHAFKETVNYRKNVQVEYPCLVFWGIWATWKTKITLFFSNRFIYRKWPIITHLCPIILTCHFQSLTASPKIGISPQFLVNSISTVLFTL